MSKYTPGPWEYSVASNYVGFAIAPRGVLPTLAAVERPIGNKSLLTVECFNFPGETEANARLISAAPELLEALERSLDWLSSYPNDACMGENGPYWQARKAIAKATGEAP